MSEKPCIFTTEGISCTANTQFCYLRSDFQESEISQHIKSTEVRAGREKFSLNPQFQVKPKANQVLYDVNLPDVAPQSSNESCISEHASEAQRAQRAEALLLAGSSPGSAGSRSHLQAGILTGNYLGN